MCCACVSDHTPRSCHPEFPLQIPASGWRCCILKQWRTRQNGDQVAWPSGGLGQASNPTDNGWSECGSVSTGRRQNCVPPGENFPVPALLGISSRAQQLAGGGNSTSVPGARLHRCRLPSTRLPFGLCSWVNLVHDPYSAMSWPLAAFGCCLLNTLCICNLFAGSQGTALLGR